MSGKRIAIYLDGTWNDPEDRTNVFVLFQETIGFPVGPQISRPFVPITQKPWYTVRRLLGLSDSRTKWLYQHYASLKNHDQLRYYDIGVGTSWFTAFSGGALGRGVLDNIFQAYEFLCGVWEPGDEIYVFGFSRGAYTARSLVGLLEIAGLASLSDLINRKNKKQLLSYFKAYNTYLAQTNSSSKPKIPGFLPSDESERRRIKVKFIGVWDTVSALGPSSKFFFLRRLSTFYDIFETMGSDSFPTNVESAFHAMAIDEHREDYQVVPWRKKTSSTDDVCLDTGDVEQMWFVGAHSNVGGGYRDNYLNEIPRHWVQRRAIQRGLRFHRELRPRKEIYNENVEDSYDQFVGGFSKFFQPPVWRKIECIIEHSENTIIGEGVHHSVVKYYEHNDDYRPQNIDRKMVEIEN